MFNAYGVEIRVDAGGSRTLLPFGCPARCRSTTPLCIFFYSGHPEGPEGEGIIAPFGILLETGSAARIVTGRIDREFGILS